MSFLAPLFLVGLAAIAVPVFVHLIQRERRDVIEFPSLMFVSRIPYQSVERRRIHNWWLLLLRAAAMALIVAAFARPFFREDPVRAAGAQSGSREVVILLDRSASMGYGDRWARAQEEARRIVGGLGGGDRATLFLFDRGVEEAVRATSNHGQLEAGIREASVSAEATRFAPALREAQSLVSRSDQRGEIFFISDFQRSGWERQEDIRLPESATLTPVSVAEAATSDLAVSSIGLQRGTFSGEERVTVTAALVNRGATPIDRLPVQLEIDGRVAGTREVSVPADGTGSVTFDAVTVAQSHVRGAIRAGTDAFAVNNSFHFVLSPSRPVSVLVIQGDAAGRNASVYLSTGLAVGQAPPFRTDVVNASRVTPADLEQRAVVVVNDVAALSPTLLDRLARFVQQGGGLFVVLGSRTPVSGEWPLLPGALSAAVDQSNLRGGTFGVLDYSHPILDEFKDPRAGNFTNMRFFRYRGLTAGPDDRVLAKFDDGGNALVERRVGSGRVIAFASTLDGEWNDAPRHAMFLPLLHETIRYLAQYEEPEAWFTVGRMLDLSAPIGALVREGQAGAIGGSREGASGVVVTPSGRQVTLGRGGAPAIELSEQGFYSVRLSGIGDRRPYAAAVNIDPAESDLSTLDPQEWLAGMTAGPAAAAQGRPLEEREITPADMEKKQSIWWFLLVGGLTALLAETVLSNRISQRFAASGGAR